MKLKLNLVILTGLCLLSSRSFAATDAEIVQNLYESGNAPASDTDFPERYYGTGNYKTPPTQLCVIVDGTDQPYVYDISRTIRFTPSEGPLIPEKTEEKLVFGNSHASFNLFQDPVVQGNDLVVTNPIYSSWTSGEDGVNHRVPATLFARKSGQYIAFKVVVDRSSQKARNGNYYGYCFTKGAVALF